MAFNTIGKKHIPTFAGIALIQILLAFRIFIEDKELFEEFCSASVQAVIIYGAVVIGSIELGLPRMSTILHCIILQLSLVIQTLCGTVSPSLTITHQFISISVSAILVYVLKIKIQLSSSRFGTIIATLLSLIAVLVALKGKRTSGAVLSIEFAEISINTVEPLKILLVSLFAWVLSLKKPARIRYALTIVLGLLSIVLFMYMNEAGTLLLVGCAVLVMCLASLPFKYTTLNFVMISIAATTIAVLGRFNSQIDKLIQKIILRFTAILQPNADELGTGYQLIKAQKAALVGGMFGSTYQVYIPVAQSDYIFSYIILKFGCIASTTIILLYLIIYAELLKSIIKIEDKPSCEFNLGCGAITLLVMQTLIPAAGNMGIVPMTGLSIPWLASGGSSMVSAEICYLYSLVIPLRGRLHCFGVDVSKKDTTLETYNKRRRLTSNMR